ncbi:hypothetical protein P3X46_013672 [Hevea brasiliensis]|uniref:non-specific serine/threonine protein kinase n=1 Tax=Hevea brasiliensis TaxID=3981 RepID=A0ABQ9M7X0_HEVBR|nr:hypothetical protein P3X46_013672 [Hevea brasiliensis]
MAFVRNCFRITEADRRSETIVWFNAGSTPREGFGLRQYNYDELAEATDKFSNRNFLGEGGFSLVYEGILDGKKVAIKKLKIRPDERSQSEEESKEEIKVISRVSHKNLVKLLGYCIEGDDILLILEYVPKKSLKHHLHGETTLEWTKRMKIAIGTAKGLEYLHENCTPKIIHRDVKAENILIDDKYEPKIADFGLALLFPETGSPTHITRSNKGTQAYADSEYYPQKVSEKSDVYAYGVVLLELISGRKTTFEGTDIVFWAKPQIEYALRSGDYTNLVDSKLLQMNYNKKEMKTMISCAMACVYKPSSSRPKMNQIVRALEGYICIEEIRNDKNDNLFPKVISLFGTSFAFPTGIDSTLSNGAQGPDPSFLDPTPTNGRDDPPDARLPNGGGQVQSICAELKSVEGYIRIGETQFEKNDNIFPKSSICEFPFPMEI